MTGRDRAVRIANCSGFFGDRMSAAREMVDGGEIDVLTGDWLAELTMLLLARNRMKHGAGKGYARSFLTQMEDVLGSCLDRGIRVVSNAGGLDPQGLGDDLGAVAATLGLRPHIGVVSGDDLVPRLGELAGAGEPMDNLDTGESLAAVGLTPLTANAYLGCGGVQAALDAGADVVVTGRVTDAALVMGPAAWWHGWDLSDAGALDALAGALVAGHAVECGTQVTGGNYAFFTEVDGLEHPGFPLVEVAADGSSVVTKHPGTGGRVDIGTVTAQLLYEIQGPDYVSPDVVARFDTVALREVGRDRVEISGTVGTPPPGRLKVAVNCLGGFRNSMTLVLTGLDVDEKAALVERTLRTRLPKVEQLDVSLVRTPADDPSTTGEAQAHLRVTVRGADPTTVGRAFSNVVVELGLASYPGFFPTAMPGDATPYGVYWPTTVARELVPTQVTVDGVEVPVAPPPASDTALRAGTKPPNRPEVPYGSWSTIVRTPFGRVFGARSGDKGGNANVGVWARDDEAWAFLDEFLTVDRFKELLPETATFEVDRHRLPNLRAVNLVVHGLLGRGVAENTLLDPQAKGLSELLRARVVDMPVELVEGHR